MTAATTVSTTANGSGKKRSPLLAHIVELENRSKDHDISLGELVQVFGHEGHFVFLLFLILPFLQPMPLFGLSTPFGLLIAVIAGFYYFKKPPVVPSRWKDKKISKKTALKIAEGSDFFFSKLEKILKPRLEGLFAEPFRSLNLLVIVANAILLALPLPIPFSNSVPAWVIFFQIIAHLERDGLLLLISYAQAVFSFLFFGALGYGALTGVNYLNSWLGHF